MHPGQHLLCLLQPVVHAHVRELGLGLREDFEGLIVRPGIDVELAEVEVAY